MRRHWLAVALLALVAWAAFAWLGDESARGKPIRVAFAGPLSGPSAEDGLSAVRAIELVFDEVNAAGGVAGRPLELESYDDANDPERARAIAVQIAEQRDTVAVVGHNTSRCSIEAGKVYAERGVPAIATAATNLAVTRGNPWYFRTIYNDRAQGRLITVYLREVLGAERFGVVHESEEYGAFLARVMQETAPAVGLPAPRTWSLEANDASPDARIAAIAREASGPGAPPVLVLAMQPTEGVALVKALRDAEYPGELVVTDALASQAFVEGFRGFPEERGHPGFHTDGIYASTPFLFDVGGRRAGDFRLAYGERHDRPPDWYAAFAADAAHVLVAAMRREQLSPRRKTLQEDRLALRDALARIEAHDAVEGVTGPTFFDSEGDADKPVPMGRFLRGEIVSAFGQLQLLPLLENPDDAGPSLDPQRLVVFGDRVLYRTEVARVGVRANRFSNIDFEKGTFDLDFNFWFRHQGDAAVEDVIFTNAVGPVDFGAPVEEVIDADGSRYRLYRTRATFRADTTPVRYGRHGMGLDLHHRRLTRLDLQLAIDTVGMNLGQRSSRAQRGEAARRLLSGGTGWALDYVVFFQSEVSEPALGNPTYLAASGGRSYSQLAIKVVVRRDSVSLRGMLAASWERPVLLIAGVASGLLFFWGAGAPRLRFACQAVAAGAVLLAAEPLLGNWARSRVGHAQLAQLTRSFDLLWWLLPAGFVNLAIDRFLWRPAEAKSGRPIPTLLRWSVASLIYLLASFGVVAFVYDYRLTGVLATSGVVAMIVGLAVQLNITNLFAGVALNLERPFRVGDWVMIHGRTPSREDGVIGQVIDVNWRTTRLQTADDTVIVIPNGQISEKTITNFMGPNEMSRFELIFVVDQTVAPERVLAVIGEALAEVTGAENGPTDEDPPKVRIKRVTETGVEYLVHYHLLPSRVSPNKGRHTVNESVLRHLREAGIELAYPRRRVFEQRVAGPEDG